MATVTITVADVDDALEVKAEFDPPANRDGAPDTPAQYTAKALLAALAEAADWDVAEAITEAPDGPAV